MNVLMDTNRHRMVWLQHVYLLENGLYKRQNVRKVSTCVKFFFVFSFAFQLRESLPTEKSTNSIVDGLSVWFCSRNETYKSPCI